MNRPYHDLLIIVVLAVLAAALSLQTADQVGTALEVRGDPAYGYDDIWFDADVRDIQGRFTTGNYEQNQTVRHPLVALLVRLPMRLYLRLSPETDPVSVVRAGLAAMAAAWVVLWFGTLRMVGLRRLDAVVFSLLGLSSAAALYWFAVPETIAFGSLTILPAVALVAAADRWGVREGLTTVAGAITFSVTITNGMFGLLAAAVLHPGRRAVQVAVNAVCIVLVLSGVQRFIYPSSGFPYGYDRSYRGFILASDMRTPAGPLAAFWFHGMVMPEVTAIDRTAQRNYPVLSAQRSLPASGGAAGVIALAAWVALLLIGAWAARSPAVAPRLKWFLSFAIAGQLGLHLVFGEETFLFAMHFVPLLLVLAALGALTRARPLVLGLAVLLLMSAGVNNLQQFERSIELAREIRQRIVL